MDEVRPGTGREGGLGYVRRDCVSFAQGYRKPARAPREKVGAGTAREAGLGHAHDCRDAGGRAPKVGALGDAGAVAEERPLSSWQGVIDVRCHTSCVAHTRPDNA